MLMLKQAVTRLCLAAVAATCQLHIMFNGKRPYLIAALGIIAMLGTLLSVAVVARPVAAHGLVVAHKVDVGPAAADTKAMPCHKSAESCPSCLKTSCADLAVCMAKCLQKVTGAAPSALVPVFLEATTLWPETTVVLPGSLIPPLLRPPIC